MMTDPGRDDAHYMELALAQARKAASFAEVPVGAVLVKDGSVLTEAHNLIETTPDGTIVWQFGLGPNDFSAKSIIGCNDAQRVGPLTLMAGTGTPPAGRAPPQAGASVSPVLGSSPASASI